VVEPPTLKHITTFPDISSEETAAAVEEYGATIQSGITAAAKLAFKEDLGFPEMIVVRAPEGQTLDAETDLRLSREIHQAVVERVDHWAEALCTGVRVCHRATLLRSRLYEARLERNRTVADLRVVADLRIAESKAPRIVTDAIHFISGLQHDHERRTRAYDQLAWAYEDAKEHWQEEREGLMKQLSAMKRKRGREEEEEKSTGPPPKRHRTRASVRREAETGR
jgi:hypothetical protein